MKLKLSLCLNLWKQKVQPTLLLVVFSPLSFPNGKDKTRETIARQLSVEIS